jgi:hypothetical protein
MKVMAFNGSPRKKWNTATLLEKAKEEFMSSLKPPIEVLRGKMPVFYTLITPLPRRFASSWYFYSMMRRFNVDDVNKLPSFDNS